MFAGGRVTRWMYGYNPQTHVSVPGVCLWFSLTYAGLCDREFIFLDKIVSFCSVPRHLTEDISVRQTWTLERLQPGAPSSQWAHSLWIGSVHIIWPHQLNHRPPSTLLYVFGSLRLRHLLQNEIQAEWDCDPMRSSACHRWCSTLSRIRTSREHSKCGRRAGRDI